MHPRAAARRLKIIESATQVFLERGFDAASMAAIAERAGGSKQTLYGHFASKAELFTASVAHKSDQWPPRPLKGPDTADSLHVSLSRFGRAFLGHALQDDSLALQRLIIAQAGRRGVADAPDGTMDAALTDLVAFCAAAMATGRLRPCKPHQAAIHFLSLLEGGVLKQRLMGKLHGVEEDAVSDEVEEVVDVFLRAYGRPPPRTVK